MTLSNPPMSSHDTFGTSTTCMEKGNIFYNRCKIVNEDLEHRAKARLKQVDLIPGHTPSQCVNSVSIVVKKERQFLNSKIKQEYVWLPMDPSPACNISSLSPVIEDAGSPSSPRGEPKPPIFFHQDRSVLEYSLGSQVSTLIGSEIDKESSPNPVSC